MKHAIALAAAAGLASVLALPASAETNQRSDGLRSKAQVQQVEHTDISSRRYYRNYGYRAYRPYRYGYYRPYRYGYRPYGPYAYGGYGPGVSFGFGGGPRLGVWF